MARSLPSYSVYALQAGILNGPANGVLGATYVEWSLGVLQQSIVQDKKALQEPNSPSYCLHSELHKYSPAQLPAA